MSYTITVTHKGTRKLEIARNITEAREETQEIVLERMAAFGDNREALERYGYLAAENWALDLPEEGGRHKLADGYEIEVVNNREAEARAS